MIQQEAARASMTTRIAEILLPIISDSDLRYRNRSPYEVRLLAHAVASRIETEMYRVCKSNMNDYENCGEKVLHRRIRLLSKQIIRRITTARKEQTPVGFQESDRMQANKQRKYLMVRSPKSTIQQGSNSFKRIQAQEMAITPIPI